MRYGYGSSYQNNQIKQSNNFIECQEMIEVKTSLIQSNSEIEIFSLIFNNNKNSTNMSAPNSSNEFIVIVHVITQ